MIAKICIATMSVCVAGVVLSLVTMIILGSIVREEQQSMFKENGCVKRRALSAFKDDAKTGDVLLVSCKAPAWSIADALFRVAEGFEETALVHAAVVYVDTHVNDQTCDNNVKIYEFTSSTHRLRPFDDFFKSNSNNIVVVRRMADHIGPPDLPALVHYLQDVGAFSAKKDSNVQGQIHYLQSTAKRFVMNEERSLSLENSCNCIDSVIMFLIKAGFCKNDDIKQIPLIRPVELLYEKIPQIPSLGMVELICT